MGKNTSIAIGDHFEGFIKNEIQKGRFNSASEVVRAGLRLLEDREAKIQALRNAIEDGQRSGYIENFDFEKRKAKLNKRALQK